MKRIVCALFCIVLVLSSVLTGCSGSSDDGDRLAQIKKAGKITVAMEGTWAPWTYHDESDQLVGYDVEVAALIAEQLGVEVEYIEGEWDGLLAGMDGGRYDLMVNGVDYTEERAAKYTFSKPYAYNRTALIVRGDNTEITCFEDLKGKTTANTISSTYAQLAESYGATVSGVDTLDQTIELLLAGRIDATLNAQVSLADYLAVHPDADLKVVCLTEEATHVCIPMPKDGSDSLKAAVDKAIDEISASGKLKELSEKYFGMDISQAE